MTIFPGVALVTGAGSGIGRATVVSFVREGCKHIAFTDRDEAGLKKTAEMFDQFKKENPEIEGLWFVTDISEEEGVERMIEECVERWGRVDYAVNCAGIIGNNQPSTRTSTKDFDRITNINYRGTWLCSRAEVAQMMKQEPLPTHDGRLGNRGAVVNIASQLGIVGRPNAPAYCASKAAVIGMTKSDAIDYAPHNIRVNCVCPGVIETPMTQSSPEFAKALEPAIAIAPMNRMGSAQEVADAILFLCSSKASFVCGHALVVDGGYVIN